MPSLQSGESLGSYRVLSLLGQGGMGEVYRAHDARLGRDVAIKILPAILSTNPEQLRRFEQEARAAAALNHPNILVVFDIGMHSPGGSAQAAPYIVSEVLDGETLRQRLNSGVIPVRTAVDYAIQIADGLAAAHDKGIVHRDLKPENIFITNEGRIKILDFGLAKLTQKEEGTSDATSMPTAQANTEPGMVMGTFGYMSPEQVRGKTVDYRTDVFSFGAVLYEMLSSGRAFEGETTADMISAILNHEPQDLSPDRRKDLPLLVEETVRHCLEKQPQARFQSMRDVAFSLRASLQSSTIQKATVHPAAQNRPRAWRYLLALAAVAALVLAAWVVRSGWLQPAPQDLSFQQLTFRRGPVWGAAFAPDGQTILYSAAWDGGPIEVYSTRLDSSESRPLGLKDASILGTTPNGDMFLLINARPGLFNPRGTVARASVAGGAPRPLIENATFASPCSPKKLLDLTPSWRVLNIRCVIREFRRCAAEARLGRYLRHTACSPYPSQQELGLKLESSKGNVEVLVIDSVSKPTEN